MSVLNLTPALEEYIKAARHTNKYLVQQGKEQINLSDYSYHCDIFISMGYPTAMANRLADEVVELIIH